MKHIKKSQLALGLAALTVVSTVGLSSATLAASKTVSTSGSATSTAAHLGANGHHGDKGDRPELTAAQKAEMETKKAEFETKKTAAEAALKANDYSAFMTAIGTDNPLASKVTEANFSRYVELYNLYQQQQAIITELGLNNGGHGPEGMGFGFGFGPGFGPGGNHQTTTDSSSTK